MNSLKRLSATGALVTLTAGALVFGATPANAVTCRPATAVPTNSYPGTVVAATSWESGNFVPFTVRTSGTGTATISTSRATSGVCSAKLHVTNDSGSLANFYTPVPSGTKTAYADGWFNITQAGVTGNNVPYFRFFSGSTRIADVYRYNNNGQLWLRVTAPSGAFVYTRLTAGSVTLNEWHRVSMRVTPNGSSTTIQVWFDGVLRFSSNQVSTGATSLSRVQLGAEHSRQMGDSYIDDVIIKASS
jgi:hypothetical protein